MALRRESDESGLGLIGGDAAGAPGGGGAGVGGPDRAGGWRDERLGLAWTLRPWMRNEVRDGNEVLYERLKANDFKHVEDRIGDGLAGVNTRLDGLDSRLDRMDSRARDDRAAMEARILEAVRGRPSEPPEAPDRAE